MTSAVDGIDPRAFPHLEPACGGKWAVINHIVSPAQDHKLKHMAELQQSVVQDEGSRHQIQAQILQWEENLERLHCEQFRLRCYMASLQSGELPNPKVQESIIP